MDKHEKSMEEIKNRLTPENFDVYLPWACNQLGLEVSVMIIKVFQNEYFSGLSDRSKSRGRTKPKTTQSRIELSSEQDKDDQHKFQPPQTKNAGDKIVRVNAIYDTSENLVHIKFQNNNKIPRSLLKIIGLIIKFQTHLTSITIHKGLDVYSIHEICKFLPTSYITDICLDGTFLKEANYYILLETPNRLRHISLARCSIDDTVLKKITENLVYPLPSSQTLCVLNISSNRITDKGAIYLAEALKSNRQLVYLNLAGNSITDEGTLAILNVLGEFPLSCQEMMEYRRRHMEYLKEKKDLLARVKAELQSSNNKKAGKKKIAKNCNFLGKKPAKGLEKDQSIALADTNRIVLNLDSAALFENAEEIALNAMGLFEDPFSSDKTTSKYDIVYCTGNNVLSYLNLSYNNLTYLSLKNILGVLMYQKKLDSSPRGLINVCIEGNCMPVVCKELSQINDILENGLRFFSTKKKLSQTAK